MNRPERIGRYRVSRLLGSGAFASVWLGTDGTLDEPVAIKVLAENWANVTDIHNRFVLEARLLRKADSDRVVRMYDIGELDDGRPYFVMSYADRGTVAARLPVSNALHVAVETARAVAVLHRMGVVHRDIKPSNVLVQSSIDGGERYLIGDLGVAKHVAQASGFTIPAGTPGYMAPEQGEQGVDIDARADVFGLGALTYHLVTGTKYNARYVRELTVPGPLKHVLTRALAPERDRRWSDAGAFADAVASVLAESEAGERELTHPVAMQSRERGESSRAPWPTAGRYSESVQRQEHAFSVPLLQKARFDTDRNGLPFWLEGQSAVTFLAETNDGPLAVRCFKRPLRAGLERYRAIEAYQRDNPTSPFATAQWHDDAIIVDGHKWPVVTMRQVAGNSLRRFVGTAIEKPESAGAVLGRLAGRWRLLTAELSVAGVAHADLQHDNVRVTADGRLCLIDLDSVWLPAVAESPPAELGHRHFQHPERLTSGHWDRYIDTFSALVIYVSLRALAADPELWEFHNDENLVFTDNDFLRPGDTTLWHRLGSSPDLEVRQLAVLLDEFCRRTVKLPTNLEEILRSSRLPDGPAWSPSDHPDPDHVPWWHDPADDNPESVAPTAEWWEEEDDTDRPAEATASTLPLTPSNEHAKEVAVTKAVEAPVRKSRKFLKILLWVLIPLIVIAGAAVAALYVWGPW